MTNAIHVGRVSVGTTATLIVAARPGREKVRISGAVLIGEDDTVTSASGYSTSDGFDGSSSAIELETDAAIYGVAQSSNPVSVSFIEFFNT